MRIGEVSELSGVSARMLRHYDKIGVLRPSERTAGGYREYSDEDLRRLFHIEGLRSLGLELSEVAEVLRDPGFSPTTLIDALITGTRERLTQEKALLRTLRQVRASHPVDWSDVLRTTSLMRGLGAAEPSQRLRVALSVDAERHLSLLIDAALSESDPNTAGALDWVVAQGGDTAVPRLTAALTSASPDRQRRAAMMLRKIGSVQSLEALAGAIAHPDPQVRGWAALERGRLGEVDAVAGLVELIVAGREDVEAADVLELLAVEHGYAAEITEALTAELAGAEDSVRHRLTESLAGIPGPGADALLARLADDASPQVAHTARYLMTMRCR